MSVGEIIFLVMIIVTMGGAAAAVLSASLVYAMIGLVAAMFGIAGLYIYLNSPFLAMMQILIYVGAISVLIAFAIMLAGPFYQKPKEWTTVGKFAAAAGVAFISLVVIVRFVMETFPRTDTAPSFSMETKDIGSLFFGRLMLPFELVSLLIVVGLLGAIMLALFSGGKR